MDKLLSQLLFALALIGATCQAYSDKGVVYVDEFTFAKVIDGSQNVLLRFDKEYAWGDAHNAFKELAKQVGEAGSDLLVVSLPIAKREYDPLNVNLAKEWGADNEDQYPLYKLFVRGVDARSGGERVLNYSGPSTKSVQEVLSWVSQHTGVFFGLPGQLRELNALAVALVGAGDASERQALLAQAEAAASLLTTASTGTGGQDKDKVHAEYYVKVMRKVMDKPSFAHAESKRLSKLLNGKLGNEKVMAMQAKLNILTAFMRDSNREEM